METISGKIVLPRCWKRLIKTVFVPAPGQLAVVLPNKEVLPVTSEHYVKRDADPMPHYDEVRTRSVKLSDGNIFYVDLSSGQGNYYGVIGIDGPVIYESEPLEDFDDFAFEVEVGDKYYVVEIEWEGEDPYEMEAYTVRFTATFETTVVVAKEQKLEDKITDIDIPENAQSKYVPDTFEVKEIWKGRESVEL
jgi:hypothetical protein